MDRYPAADVCLLSTVNARRGGYVLSVIRLCRCHTRQFRDEQMPGRYELVVYHKIDSSTGKKNFEYKGFFLNKSPRFYHELESILT